MDDLDHAIYMLQTIEIQGKQFNLFFECKKDAVVQLESMGRSSKDYRRACDIVWSRGQ